MGLSREAEDALIDAPGQEEAELRVVSQQHVGEALVRQRLDNDRRHVGAARL